MDHILSHSWKFTCWNSHVTVAHIYNPNTWEMETVGPGTWKLLQSHGEFKANLGGIRACVKNRIGRKPTKQNTCTCQSPKPWQGESEGELDVDEVTRRNPYDRISVFRRKRKDTRAPFSPHKDRAMTAIYQPERGPYPENLQTRRAWASELWEINIIILSFIICGNLL